MVSVSVTAPARDQRKMTGERPCVADARSIGNRNVFVSGLWARVWDLFLLEDTASKLYGGFSESTNYSPASLASISRKRRAVIPMTSARNREDVTYARRRCSRRFFHVNLVAQCTLRRSKDPTHKIATGSSAGVCKSLHIPAVQSARGVSHVIRRRNAKQQYMFACV